MTNINIRVATEDDAKALLSIYSPYVLNTAITFEYTVPSLEEFKERIHNTLNKYPYLVAEIDNEIVGYTYAGPFKGRAAYDWAVETTIYIKHNLKKKGIGRKLYTVLEKALTNQNILNLYSCIAVPEKEDEYLTNDSIHFHECLGYKITGEFHKCGFKFNRWYNMVWMEKYIGTHSENPKPVTPFIR